MKKYIISWVIVGGYNVGYQAQSVLEANTQQEAINKLDTKILKRDFKNCKVKIIRMEEWLG